MKRDKIYLQHIIDAVSNIENFIQGIKKENFLKNNLVQSAVVRQLEIIGEAVKSLSPETRKKHKEVQWKDIAGLIPNRYQNG